MCVCVFTDLITCDQSSSTVAPLQQCDACSVCVLWQRYSFSCGVCEQRHLSSLPSHTQHRLTGMPVQHSWAAASLNSTQLCMLTLHRNTHSIAVNSQL